jgi:hypothetical protein
MSDFIWAFLVGLFLIYETVTLLAPVQGDTFSEKFWQLSCNRLWRSALFGLVFWLVGHFLVEPYLPWDLSGSSWEDLLVVAAGLIVGWFMPASKWRGNCDE